MPALLIATDNPGKRQEYQALFADLPYTLLTLREAGITQEIPEPGQTFAENAGYKATLAARLSRLLTLADDSGLEVDVLHGAPGVRSKRYAGPEADDAARRARLLAELAAVPWEQRTARFRCVIAITEPTSGQTELCEGIVEGVIALEERGTGGFGYDSIFYLSERGKTMAELSAEEKNAISHRARAAAIARGILRRLQPADSSDPQLASGH